MADESEGWSHADIQGKAFQAEGPASREALRQESSWLFGGTAKKTMSLELWQQEEEWCEMGSERVSVS